ncbi:hypothetical protein ACH5RR_005326 [Cinchona calisaya]|uniref:Uncharacterized protein n=1 Tax=Cinchona calisaya TaxID=153742 RepID=A0ABD3AKW5_9GENT
MEENIICTTEINSVPIEKVLQTSIAYMDRKRKLQAEELGTPPSKHKWSSQSLSQKGVLSFNAESDGEGVYRGVDTGDLGEMSRADDDSEQESVEDSNSFAADADSTISVCNEAEVGADEGYLKECSSHQHFTSSVDWRGNCSKHALNSSKSSSVTKSSSTVLESPSIGREHEFSHHDYEDHLLEFGSRVDCSCSECRTSFEECTDKEIEEMLYCNGVTPNNYVLSSGRWTPNQVVYCVSVPLGGSFGALLIFKNWFQLIGVYAAKSKLVPGLSAKDRIVTQPPEGMQTVFLSTGSNRLKRRVGVWVVVSKPLSNRKEIEAMQMKRMALSPENWANKRNSLLKSAQSAQHLDGTLITKAKDTAQPEFVVIRWVSYSGRSLRINVNGPASSKEDTDGSIEAVLSATRDFIWDDTCGTTFSFELQKYSQ